MMHAALTPSLTMDRKPTLLQCQRKEIMHRMENGKAAWEIARKHNIYNSTLSSAEL